MTVLTEARLTLIIIFVVIILVIIKLFFFINVNDEPRKKNNKISFLPIDFKKKIVFKEAASVFFDELKSGDLLFISYKKSIIRLNFVKFFCNSIWTHVGIFYKDPITKEAFILEAASYHPPYFGQFIKIPFTKWLYINRNQKIAVKPINKEIDSQSLLEVKNKLKFKCKDGFCVEDLNWRWIRFLYTKKKKPFYFKNPNAITCTEYVIKIYKKLGIFKPLYHSSSYYPACLYKMKNIEMKNGYFFEEPYLLNGFENNNEVPY